MTVEGGADTIGARIRASAAVGSAVFSTATGSVAVTVSDVLARAGEIEAALAAIGIGPGDVVAVQVPASLDSYALVGAAWQLGAVVLPVVDIYGPRELGFVLAESGASLLAASPSWRGRSGLADARSGGYAGPMVSVDAIGAPTGSGDAVDSVPLDALVERARSGSELTGVDRDATNLPAADDVALLIYTSGTTAQPKGVQHTHATVLAAFPPPGVAIPAAPGPTLATFPAGHVAGTLSALRMLLVGGDTVVMDRWSATRAAALVEEHRVVASAGTPFYLQGLLDAAERDGRDLSSLMTFLTGAAPVPPSLLARARDRGILSWRSYGSTEHPSISSCTPLDPEHKRLTTDGKVADGVELRFVDDDGNDVAAGLEGEICVRGPKLFVGYRDPALDADAFLPGGWFRTGDVGRLDADGYLVITDRKKDIIIRGGENIASKEVEDVLAAHPSVAEVAVVPRPDEALGESVWAHVRLAPGASLTLDDVIAHFARADVPRQKVPEHLTVVEDFPRTAAGKIRKSDLRR